ncbi:MAG: Fur family transcriptional regulator [Candidatus Sericytochromatia bacterium]
MSDYPKLALELLKKKGFRQTKPREMVLNVLDESEISLSPYDIVDYVKNKGEKADVVSVYRILQAFEENGIVHRVLSSGKYRKCHLSSDMAHHDHSTHCHHNLVCQKCGKIEEINCQGMSLIEQVITSTSAFKIENHALEFYGTCGACQ